MYMLIRLSYSHGEARISDMEIWSSVKFDVLVRDGIVGDEEGASRTVRVAIPVALTRCDPSLPNLSYQVQSLTYRLRDHSLDHRQSNRDL